MTVMVTGGAGYIGSHVILALHDQGESVLAFDDLSTGFRSAVPSGVPFVLGDIADTALVRKAIEDHGVRSIMHFAARTVVSESVARPLSYYSSNTEGTRCLLDAAVSVGIEHFIFSSTAAVYGEPQRIPVSETDCTLPINPYGRSKLISEWMVQDVAGAHALKYAILRYFNVAGADPGGRSGQSTADATHLIKRAIQTALGLQPRLEVFGTDYPTPDGTCIRDYIHVSDLAVAHVHALLYLRKGGPNGIFNCGYGRGYSVLEVTDAVKEVSGIDFEVRFSPRRPGDPAAIIAASDVAREKLGWTPQYDMLTDMVGHAMAWERRLVSRQGVP